MPANKKPGTSKPIASIVLINKNERGVDAQFLMDDGAKIV